MTSKLLADLIARLDQVQLLREAVDERVNLRGAPTHDSRRIQPGSLFVAIPGRVRDGAAFVGEAVARGAVAVLSERPVDASVPVVLVQNARAALAHAAAWWEGDPSDELIAIGVTGTDGKTTTSTFLSTALTAAGLPTGLVSTAINRIGGAQRGAAAHQTTPEAPELQRTLRQMVEAGDEAVVIESTSHGLELERVGAIGFAAAIYTTFSPDHLDFHDSLEHYRAAKAKLVTKTVGSTASQNRKLPLVVVVHATDPEVQPFARAAASAGLHVARFDAYSEHEVLVNGERMTLDLTMPGRINAANAAAALTLLSAWGLPLERARAAIEAEPGPPGRSQIIDSGQPFRVLIDFAHTGPSLRAAIGVARAMCVPGGRLLLVTGAAGERDRGRRGAIGQAATAADEIWIADEDPRGEDPDLIAEEIRTAFLAVAPNRGERLVIQHNRAEAVRLAIGSARPGDVVLLAGKGHERTIERRGHDEPWDEEGVARSALASLGYPPES